MLLGFKKQFVEKIQIGTKVHTMRDKRKVQPKIGEQLHMYTALRTKYCQLITNKEILISKQKAWVKITFHLGDMFYIDEVKICVDGRVLSFSEKEQFVRFDGFHSVLEFAWFWLENSGLKKQIKKDGKIGETLKLVASKDLYHWTDLRY